MSVIPLGDKNVLKLNDFEFATTCEYGIKFIGDSIVQLDENSVNTINVKYTGANNTYGLYAENNLHIKGISDEHKGVLKVHNNDSQGCPRPHHQNAWICDFNWLKGQGRYDDGL